MTGGKGATMIERVPGCTYLTMLWFRIRAQTHNPINTKEGKECMRGSTTCLGLSTTCMPYQTFAIYLRHLLSPIFACCMDVGYR